MGTEPLRGTQSVVGQMGWVFARPSLTALEVLWRWLFGAPFLLVCWQQAQHILAELPPESAGLSSLNFSDPWGAAIKLAAAWDMYWPHVAAVLLWLAPAAALGWAIVSGIGRNFVLKRMDLHIPLRPFSMIVLQAARIVLFALTGCAWFCAIGWAAKTHIGTGVEPDLIGYTVWSVFLTLAFVSIWALISWIVTVAPLLMLLEDCSVASALARSFRLGKPFTSKLIEINFVMSIVKLALIVVAMVLSSVLIPFSEEIGASALHLEWLVVSLFYFVANDYFQVVRLKGFMEFWHMFRQ